MDGFQRRHSGLGFPLAVVYKFFDDQGSYLAGLITYYGFVSLFPLLLIFVTLLGFALQGNPHLQQQLLNSALSQFPAIGDNLRTQTHPLTGNTFALVIGIVGSLYGGLGVAQALQNALNRVWAVPRNERPNPFKARLRSLLLLAVLGLGIIVTTALSGLATGATAFGLGIGTELRYGAIALSVAVNAGLFILGFRVLTARDIGIRDVLLGAIVAAVGWQVLQSLGTYYLSHKLKGAGQVYGLFGLVLGLLAWIYLEALVVVLSAEINVVWRKRLWPRALLTPFTDAVHLTHADERAYGSYARAERFKGFERVDVAFDPHGQDEPPG